MTKKSSNGNLRKAKKAKNDEFYTQLSDIERELDHYKDHFKDKVVFLNCDNPEDSNFWRYFSMNFKPLGLSKLISTHYERDIPSYKLEIVADVNNLDAIMTPLKQNGDFRSPECVELLKEADIVVTNPPFSLFREYLTMLMEYDKKFLIIGNMNAITYKETFKFIKNNQLWLGVTNFNKGMYFQVPKDFVYSDTYKFEREREGLNVSRVPGVCWFANIDTKKRHEDLILWKTYKGNEPDYPMYDNYDAINVDKVKDIPVDYEGAMGVPITFLDKYNPEQFEILGNLGSYAPDGYSFSSAVFVDGKKIFKRLLIKLLRG